MAIDTSGKWWTGTEAGDIDAYLVELVKGNGGYAPSRFVHAICSSCAGAVFGRRQTPISTYGAYASHAAGSSICSILRKFQKTNATCSPSSAPAAMID